jgi:hypothetical protein
MGLTPRGVLEQLRAIKAADPEEFALASYQELAIDVVDELSNLNPQAYDDASADWDWDAIFAFIERLIELLMKLFM